MTAKKKDAFDVWAEVMHKRTVKWATKEEIIKSKTKAKKLDPKAVALGKFIDEADFGCKKESVKGLMSIVTGLDIPESPDTEGDVDQKAGLGFFIKMTDNEHNHNYNTGDVIETYIDSGDSRQWRGIKSDGDAGNHPDAEKSSIAIPTVTEIADYLRTRYS